MPGLDDLLAQQEAAAKAAPANVQPLSGDVFGQTGTSPTANTMEGQGYVKGFDAATTLSGLSGSSDQKGDLGDTRHFDEGRIFFNEDLDKARAANQTTFQKWGNAAIKTIVGVPLGIGEIAGHMLDLENVASLVTGANNNYDNWFSKAMRDTRESLDEALPIFQSKPGKAWNPGDAGWWAANASGVVESMIEFYGVNYLTGGLGGLASGGAAAGRALSLAKRAKMLKGVANMTPDKMLRAQAVLDSNAAAINVWNNVAQAGSAFEMGMATSAMNSVGTYETVRDQTMKTTNPKTGNLYTKDEAEFIASKAAASTYQTGLLFNTMLNYTSITPFFRGKAVTPRSKIKAQANETTDDMLTRFKSLRNNPEALRDANKWYDKWYVDAASEMGQGAVEEYGEALAGQIGVNKGEEMTTGKSKPIDLFNEENLSAAFLGLVGGGVGKGLKSFFDRGNDAKENESLTTELDYRINQIESYRENQTKLAEAKKSNNTIAAAEAESKLFTNQLFDSIVNDTTDLFVAQMEEIAKMSIEDAKAKGFQVDETAENGNARSDDYRSRAKSAIELVKQGKNIATAVQQDTTLQPELKEHVMRTQLQAAFNEQVILGIESDLNLLGNTEAGNSYAYTDRLQTESDALGSLIDMYKRNRSGGKKQLAYLESEKTRIDTELKLQTNEEVTGKKYEPTAARTGRNYMARAQMLRELYSRKAQVQSDRDQLGKLMSPEHQKATIEYITAAGKRPGQKGMITQKMRNLVGKFFALGVDGSPQDKAEIIAELRALENSGEFEALDLIDPNDEGLSKFDTKTEVMQEVMNSFASPEDMRAFIDSADIGTYDENGNLVDDGTVQRKIAVKNQDGTPVFEDAVDAEGKPYKKLVVKNDGRPTTLADLYGRLKGTSNDFNKTMSAAEMVDSGNLYGDNKLKALISTLEATFDADKQAMIDANKAKVAVKLGEMRDTEMAEAEAYLAANINDIRKELGIETSILVPEAVAEIQDRFNAVAARLEEEMGLIGRLAADKLLDMLNGMIPEYDTRYEGTTLASIVNGQPMPKEQVSFQVVFTTRNLDAVSRTDYRLENKTIRTAEGLDYVPGKGLKNVPGFIEYLNGKWVFIPDTASDLDNREDFAIELSEDALNTPIEQLGMNIVQQESYPISLAVAENKKDVFIGIGNYQFRLNPMTTSKDIEIDEDGNLKAIYLEDENGLPYIITDPVLMLDLADFMGMYAIALQEFAEQPVNVTVVNLFGVETVYQVKYFDVVNPENSLVVTGSGVDVSHHKLRSEGGALTMKGKALQALQEKFAKDIVTTLADEINKRTPAQSVETEGTQESGQTNESEGNTDGTQGTQESQQGKPTESFTESQTQKIRDYGFRYENSVRGLIQDKDLEGLKEAKAKFEKIAKYAGDSDEVISQREAATKVLKLIHAGMKQLDKTSEERGNNVANNTPKLDPKRNTRGESNSDAAASLYTTENDVSPSLLTDNFSIAVDGLTVASSEAMKLPSEGDMIVIQDGDYSFLASFTNGRWKAVAVANSAEPGAAIMQKGSDKAVFVKSDGTTGEWYQSQLDKRLENVLAGDAVIAYNIDREAAGKIYTDIKARHKQFTSGKKTEQQVRIKEDLKRADGRTASTQLFTTPNVVETWKLPNGKVTTLIKFDNAGMPLAPVMNDEHITSKGLDMLHNPNITGKTHTIRFKIFEGGNTWWNKQDAKTKEKRNQLFPIYVELVDRVTGETIIVGRLADAQKGQGLEERTAILSALDRNEKVTAEMGTDGGFNRRFSMNRGEYSNVLNTFDDKGKPVFYSVYNATNGITNTWHRESNGFTKTDQQDKIILLTTVGMSPEKSLKGDASDMRVDLSGTMQTDRAAQTWLKSQLGATKLANITEGQILTPMVTPSGAVTVVPLSTANLTPDVISDFFMSPLKKLDANAVSEADIDNFVTMLNQVLSTTSKPTKEQHSMFQVDKVKDKNGKFLGANIKMFSPKHNSYITIPFANREGATGIIQALTNGTPMTATITTVSVNGDNFSMKNTGKNVEITQAELMDMLKLKKFNVRKDKMNGSTDFTITNPTTGTTQTFQSYNAFVIGMPDINGKPNAIMNEKKKGNGTHASILSHNFMNNNGTIFSGAGVVTDKLSVQTPTKRTSQKDTKDVTKETKTTAKTTTTTDSKKATATTKLTVDEVEKRIQEVRQNKKFIKLVTKLKEPIADKVVTSRMAGAISSANDANARDYNPDAFGKDLAKQAAAFPPANKITTVDGVVTINTDGKPLSADAMLGLKEAAYANNVNLIIDGVVTVKGKEVGKRAYINLKTGQVYESVTAVISDEEVDENDPTVKSAVDIGNLTDDLVREFFSVGKKGNWLYYTDEATGQLMSEEKFKAYVALRTGAGRIFPTTNVDELYKFMQDLNVIRNQMISRGEVPFADGIVLYDDELGIAGTVDLLTLDKNGVVRIYDLKTMKGNQLVKTHESGDNVGKTKYDHPYKKGKDSNRVKHQKQLSLYRILLANTHGLVAQTTAVLPVEVEYNKGDAQATKLSVVKTADSKVNWISHEPMDKVGKYKLRDTEDTIEPVAEEIVEEADKEEIDNQNQPLAQDEIIKPGSEIIAKDEGALDVANNGQGFTEADLLAMLSPDAANQAAMDESEEKAEAKPTAEVSDALAALFSPAGNMDMDEDEDFEPEVEVAVTDKGEVEAKLVPQKEEEDDDLGLGGFTPKKEGNKLFRKSLATENQIDIKAASKWLNKRGIKFDEQKQILTTATRTNNEKIHGYFHDNLVYLSSTAEVGTEFHEAFHAVFRTWTTKTQQRQLLAEAKSTYREPSEEELADLRKTYPTLNSEQMLDLYYEEVMAEKFREYTITKQKPRTIGERLWKWLKDLFAYIKTYTSNKRTIDQLFSNIESGRINKRYVRPSGNSQIMYSKEKAGYDSKSRDHIVNAISSAFVQKYDLYKDAGIDIPSATNIFREIRKEFTMEAVERLVPMTNPENQSYAAFTNVMQSMGLSPESVKLQFGKMLSNMNKAFKNGEKPKGAFSGEGIDPRITEFAKELYAAKGLFIPHEGAAEAASKKAVTSEAIAKLKEQLKGKTGAERTKLLAEIQEAEKMQKAIKEAKAFLDVNDTWNSTPRDEKGFLLPEPGWIDLAVDKLSSFGIGVKGTVTMDELEIGDEKIYSKDSVEENRMDSLSGKLKNILSRVPASNERTLGIVPYVPLNEITATMQLVLTEFGGARSVKQMFELLEDAGRKDPRMKAVYDMALDLAMSPKQSDRWLINEMYSGIASMVNRSFQTLQEKVVKGKKGKYETTEIKTFDSNSQRLTKVLLTRWKNNAYRPGNIYTVSSEGKVNVDAQILDQLKKYTAELTKVRNTVEPKHVDMLSKAYALLGVELSPEVISAGLTAGMQIGKDKLAGAALFKHLVNDSTNVQKSSGRGFNEVVKRLGNDKDAEVYAYEMNFFKKAATFAAQFDTITNLSFYNSQGKNIFPINMHTSFTRQMNGLIYYGQNDVSDAWVDDLMKDPLYNHVANGRTFRSPLLKLALDGKGDLIEMTTLDAYKRDGETISNNDFTNLSEVGEWLYRFNAFANNGSTSSMFIVAPTLSDRGNSMMVKLPRIGTANHSNDWGLSIREMFRNMIVQDIKSMQQAYQQIQEAKKKVVDNTDGLLAYYHYNVSAKGKVDFSKSYWKGFGQLAFLNNTAVGKELIAKFAETTDEQYLTDLDSATSMIAKALTEVDNYIAKQEAIAKVKIAELNLHQVQLSKYQNKDGNYDVTGITNPIDLKLWNGDINAFIKDYVIADLISKPEIVKFTGGDRRQFKGGTVEAFSKRYGATMTPGSESAIEGEEIAEGFTVEQGDMPDYAMAIVDDAFSEDDSYEFMQTLLDLPGVDKAKLSARIESTYSKNGSNKADAMGYTTLQKHRAKLLGTRGWSDMHEQAYNNYVAGREFAVYNDRGEITYRPTLNPLKTFHDGIYMYNGKAVRVMTKHSTFPLLREFTKNSPRFDKLRERMEATGEYADLEPIDEVNHISAIKTGIMNVNSKLETTDDFRSIKAMPFRLNTANQRIPQVIPDRVKANKLGSQLMKLAPAALSKFPDSKYQVGKSSMTGTEVFNKYQDVLTQMQNNSLDKLYKRLGYNPNGMSGDAQLQFMNKFRRILRTVVEERGLSNNYLKTLDIVPDAKNGGYKFAVPMNNPAFGYKFEQMMISLFKNGPLSLNTNGKAFVQIAEFGTHVKDGSLKFLHSKDGKLQAAEIAIPWEMAEKMGLAQDENGDFDISKIDERLLTIVGYRIPTQGKSAMLPLKIVRILPKSMGKVMLVPGEITSQMGSDFDIDKMYTMMPNYSTQYDTKTGSYNRTKEFGEMLRSRLGETNTKIFNDTFTSEVLENLWNDARMIEDMYADGDIDAEMSLEQLYEAVSKAKADTIDDMKAQGISDKPKAVYTNYDLNNIKNNTQAQLENMFLDLTYGILSNPNHLLDVLSPVDSNTCPSLKRIASMLIKSDDMTEKLDQNDIRTEITLAMRNKVGKAGIGMYATHMTGAAVSEYTSTRVIDNNAVKTKSGAFTALNLVEDKNGNSIIYSFSKHLTMAVDNANDPQMAFLNDNLETSTVTAFIIRSGVVVPGLANKLASILDGKPEDFDFDGSAVEVATVMRLQPAILALVKHMQNNDLGPAQIDDAIIALIINNNGVVRTEKDTDTTLFNKAAAKLKQLKEKFTNTTPLDFVAMVDYIGKPLDFSTREGEYQFEILMNWTKYQAAASEMSQVNKVIFNTDVLKNGMSSLGDLEEVEDIRASLFAKERPLIMGYEMVYAELNDPNNKNPYPIAKSYANTLREMKNFMGGFLPHASDNFSFVFETVKGSLGKKRLAPEHYNEVSRFASSYLLSLPNSPVAHYFKPEFYVPLLRKVKNSKNSNTIVDKLNKVKLMILNGQLEDLAGNKFLSMVDEHPDNHRRGVKNLALKFNSGAKLTTGEQDSLIEEFQDLFNHENEVVRDLADALLAYNIVAKGMKSGPDSFADLIPIDAMADINAYLTGIGTGTDLNTSLRFMADKFIENNAHVKGLVSFMRTSDIDMDAMQEATMGLEEGEIMPLVYMLESDEYVERNYNKYTMKYEKGTPVLYKFYSEINAYSRNELVIDGAGKLQSITTIPIQKGEPYKLYELNTDGLTEVLSAVQQDADERSDDCFTLTVGKSGGFTENLPTPSEPLY